MPLLLMQTFVCCDMWFLVSVVCKEVGVVLVWVCTGPRAAEHPTPARLYPSGSQSVCLLARSFLLIFSSFVSFLSPRPFLSTSPLLSRRLYLIIFDYVSTSVFSYLDYFFLGPSPSYLLAALLLLTFTVFYPYRSSIRPSFSPS